MEHFSVCVFCGSRSGDDPAYLIQAEKLGNLIAKHKWRLVYGAGNTGMMGSVANATQLGKAKTFGVIPHHLVEREVGKKNLCLRIQMQLFCCQEGLALWTNSLKY